MGLDMYLTKRSYVKNWKHKEKNHVVNVKFDGKKRKDIKGDRVREVVEDVMYWRKANHIHNWFVSNCQGGVDECQEALVTPDQLKELLTLCEKAIETKDTSILPCVQGFFFGSNEHDERYYEDIKDTIEVLTELFKEEYPNDAYGPDFYYQSSW